MRLFFPPQLRVGVEDVARPLPDVVQLVQLAADGVVGGAPARLAPDLLLEQGHGPGRGWVAEALGRAAEQPQQQVVGVLSQERRAARPVGVSQGGRVVGQGVGTDPVVDALSRYAQHGRDVGRRPTTVELQDGKGAAVQAGITGLRELAPQPAPLVRGQLQLAHGTVLPTRTR
jgi:hypothetical protein